MPTVPISRISAAPYERTLLFADSCRALSLGTSIAASSVPRGRYVLRSMGNLSLLAPEIKWFHDSVNTNYQIILDIRNESAVAALALHEWQLYSYDNRICTQALPRSSRLITLLPALLPPSSLRPISEGAAAAD